MIDASGRSIPTPYSLQIQQLRLERNVAAANRAIAGLRRGQSLWLQYQSGRPYWSLSGGKGRTMSIPADVAAIIIRHADVVPADAGLFETSPGQVWRYRYV